MQSLDPAKYPLPEPYPYKEAAQFFKEPEVTPADQLPALKWTPPDEEALVAYLVGECSSRTVLGQQGGLGCAGQQGVARLAVQDSRALPRLARSTAMQCSRLLGRLATGQQDGAAGMGGMHAQRWQD